MHDDGSVIGQSRAGAGLGPADFAAAVGRRPVLDSAKHDWREFSLQRFQVPRFDVQLGGCRTDRVTLHLAGPVLIERKRDGRRDSRWSEPSCSSVIPKGVPVDRTFEGPANFMVVYVEPRVVAEVAYELFDLHAECTHFVESFAVQDRALESLGRSFLNEGTEPALASRLYVDTLSRALAVHLLRAYHDTVPASAEACSLVDARVRRATDYMHEHLAENLSLSRIAKAVELSPSHFLRSFRATTGQSPHRYLTEIRIDRAKQLLEHSRMPIIDIAMQCGFGQASHFSTMFRRIAGTSPRNYRLERLRF